MVMVDLLQKNNLVSIFFNIFESFESSLLRTCSLFYPIKTLVHDIITCGRGYISFIKIWFSQFCTTMCHFPVWKCIFVVFLRSMPEKVGQKTNLKNKQTKRKLLKVLNFKESREKKVCSWPFVPNGQFTKEEEELKAAIVLSGFQKYSHYNWASGLFWWRKYFRLFLRDQVQVKGDHRASV